MTLCKNCAHKVVATAENLSNCPYCLELVCFECGCTPGNPCVRVHLTIRWDHYKLIQIPTGLADAVPLRTDFADLFCEWTRPGLCNFCYWRTAKEKYQEVTANCVLEST